MTVIGWDLDGVLFPWHRLAWESYRDDFDKDMTFNDFWKYPDGYVAKHDGSTLIHNIVHDLSLYGKVDANKLYVDAVNRVSDTGMETHYITARPVEVQHYTYKWLRDNGFPMFENLHFADEVDGGKPIIAEQLGIDFFVEDRSSYIQELSKICKVFIINTPYNINDDLEGIRVDDVVDVANCLTNGQLCKDGWRI